MAEVKGIKVNCPKCGRQLFQTSFTCILLAPHTLFLIFCGNCGIAVNLPDAFPDLFHIAKSEELLPTTVPYHIERLDERES